MKKKGRYFRETTRQQRILLFETYESTGSVNVACEKAHVSRQVFYDWKPRFDANASGSTMPVTDRPYLISLSLTL